MRRVITCDRKNMAKIVKTAATKEILEYFKDYPIGLNFVGRLQMKRWLKFALGMMILFSTKPVNSQVPTNRAALSSEIFSLSLNKLDWLTSESGGWSSIITAVSTIKDKNGKDRNMTWYTFLDDPSLAQQFAAYGDPNQCLTAVRVTVFNLTKATFPVSKLPKDTRASTIPTTVLEATIKPGDMPNITTQAVETAQAEGPSHCDVPRWPFQSDDPRTWPLRMGNTSDPEGIQADQLDIYKFPSVANYTLNKHNCLRSQVSPGAGNMLKLEWNDEAAYQAQQWADQCQYQHNNDTNRTTSAFTCGQNIAYTSPWPFSWDSVINMWFGEKDLYTFGEPNELHVVGHYTAMTWATTFQLGCAYKDCGDWHFYVCHYCPNGNFGDLSQPYKLGKPCQFCPGSCDRGLCTNRCLHTNVYSNCDELEQKYKICSSRFQEKLAINCKATCLCPGGIYL